ncbi:hypothetical protein OEZ85_006275 [Tetradesmus obliquus]|uniref:C-type lectin domain-containing protein n=1 Tax=Tetradesmus obliquus TaxID=3088 RepID=A0ABY8TYT2_TETOB|nr:hypothetical protein OEZ85_006275 [Tetradesmus obliquus]
MKQFCTAASLLLLLLLCLAGSVHGQVLFGVNMSIPDGSIPADPACSTRQTRPNGGVCPALMAEEEVIRGFGTFYDSTCASAAGDWGGVNCCRTCIWHNTSVAQFASDDLPACPPCVRQYYEAAFRLANASLNVVPLIAYLNPEKCPFGANGWLYNPANDRCYYKSSGRRGISSGFDNAVMRCNTLHAGASMININDAQEDEFVRLNLLYAGTFGETYTGLKKLGSSDPAFDNQWYWLQNASQLTAPLASVGSRLLPTSYNNFNYPGRGISYSEAGPLCMEILPQKPKFWNPFACDVIKQYLCERAPVQPGENYTTPALPCTGPPAAPAGTARTVLLDYWTEAGRRLVNVDVDGVRVISSLDVFAAAGARFTAARRTVSVIATAASMTIRLSPTTDNAVLAALEVYDMGPAGPSSPGPVPASPSPVPAGPSPAPATPSPVPASPSPAPASPSPVPATPSPAPASPSPVPASCIAPALPPGAVGTVARVNFGGPAICGFAADPATGTGAVTATGAPENWYTRAAACSSCSSAPTVACLACTVRFGNPVSITVPGVTAGRAYTLRFTFSEVWWTEAGRRSFDVTVGGAPVLARVDVFDAAQARFVGVVREVNVTAASGSLAVGLAATADNAIIAALEVYDLGVAPAVPPPSPSATPPPPAPASSTPSPTPVPPPPPSSCTPAAPAGAAHTVLAVNAGGPAICGYSADTAAAPAAIGGSAESWLGRAGPAACPTSCSTAPSLACAACTVRVGGSFSYSVPTTPGRTYLLRLTFSEVWFRAAGARRFDVRVNGATVLPGVDPYALAGAKFARAVQEVTVVAPAGAGMAVSFVATLDNAILAAMEVYEMAP